ncbi:MAG: phosphoserine phosphatase SerB [Geminicoccaceae bacterium]|nr:phosphoserine phosphatase SerB [Geminicoccaceae bacterium]
MSDILVLIGDPARAALPAILERLAAAAGSRFRWLAPGEACEFDPAPPRRLDPALDDALSGVPHDRAILPRDPRLIRLLVSDMDSTMITVECIDELADLVGVKSEVAAITRRAMNGELDFEAALHARVALLEGLEETVFEEIWRTRVELMPGALTLIRTMRRLGGRTVLVSGGFLPIVARVADALGFDRAEANVLEVRAGRLTGRVVPPVRGARHKLEVLREERARAELGAAATLAIGDGANDLEMLNEAGLGVAFRAQPRVAARARVSIKVGDLSAMLYLQGVTRSEFV